MKIGTDPEFFLYKDGLPIPATGLLGGSKGEPRDLGRGVGIQEDNVMGEFTFDPVSLSDPAKLYDDVQFGIEQIKIITGYEVVFEPSALFKPKQLASKKASEFGCSFDWNVYEGYAHKVVPEMPENTRFAGGHIHFGDDKYISRKHADRLTKTLDLFLVMPAITKDECNARRKAYGKPGTLRYKPYGFEYRSPSNFWLCNEENLRWVFNQIKRAVNFLESGGKIDRADQLLIYNSVKKSQLEPKLFKKYEVEF